MHTGVRVMIKVVLVGPRNSESALFITVTALLLVPSIQVVSRVVRALNALFYNKSCLNGSEMWVQTSVS